jgi:hypothetical protein
LTSKTVVTDPDNASNPTDDAMIAVLEDHKDVVQELVALINTMSEDEQIALSHSLGLAAATAASKIGANCERKRRGLTTGIPPSIC